MYKWGMASTAVCECGTKEQTDELVIISCLIIITKWSPCSLRCHQEPGDLAEGNTSGHLVDHPDHPSPPNEEKEGMKILGIKINEFERDLKGRLFFRKRYFLGTKIKKSGPSEPQISKKSQNVP